MTLRAIYIQGETEKPQAAREITLKSGDEALILAIRHANADSTARSRRRTESKAVQLIVPGFSLPR